MTDDITVINSFKEKNLAPNLPSQEDSQFADAFTDLPDIISLIPPTEHGDMLASTEHRSDVVPFGTAVMNQPVLSTPPLVISPTKRSLEKTSSDGDGVSGLGSVFKAPKISGITVGGVIGLSSAANTSSQPAGGIIEVSPEVNISEPAATIVELPCDLNVDAKSGGKVVKPPPGAVPVKIEPNT